MKNSRCDMDYGTYVKFESMEEILDFVRRMEKCEDDVCLMNGTIRINAKSILGILALGIGRKLNLIRRKNNEISESGI